MARWTPDTVLTYVNQDFRQLLGNNANSLIGQSYLSLMPDESQRQRFKLYIKRLWQERKAQVHEQKVILTNGEVCWLRWIDQPIEDQKGKIVEFQSIGIDITHHKHSETKFRHVFEASPFGIMILDLSTFQLLEVNQAVIAMLDYTAPELLTHRLIDLLRSTCSDDSDHGSEVSSPVPQLDVPIEARLRAKSGRTVWVKLHLTGLIDQDGHPYLALAMLENITAWKAAETALRASESRYRTLVQNLPGAVYLAYPSSIYRPGQANHSRQSSGWTRTIQFMSAGVCTILGYDPAILIGDSDQSFDSIIDPEDRQIITRTIRAAIEHHIPFQVEYRCVTASGQIRWVMDRGQGCWDDQGELQYIDGVLLDITDLKTAEAQLAYRTSHDLLTGLPNRALFFKHLDRALQQSQFNADYQFAVLMLDVDNFKLINDSMGHSIGDQLLIEIGARLRTCLRPGDFIARLGGDEFAVHLTSISGLTDVTLVAERIQQVMRQPFCLRDLSITVTISIGITLQNPDSIVIYHQAHDMLRDAEIAMYRAKQDGRSQFALYDTSMHQRAMERLEMEATLRYACEQQQFVVYFQPIVQLDSGRVAGFEALVRWPHPVHGLLLPDKFIPIAEETGLILAIDDLVLNMACRQLMQWHHQGCSAEPVFVSVNLSAHHFKRNNLVERIAQILQETGLPPGLLRLEITETVLIHNTEKAHQTLHQLTELGVHISLDDFGTGYSSLSYIHQFPMHVLKIDRSFVANLHQRTESVKIVTTIIALAKSLNLKVIAEGIETNQHRDCLADLHCEYGQGFLFAKPLTPQAAEAMLQLHNT